VGPDVVRMGSSVGFQDFRSSVSCFYPARSNSRPVLETESRTGRFDPNRIVITDPTAVRLFVVVQLTVRLDIVQRYLVYG
jgi:hypothetical protein